MRGRNVSAVVAIATVGLTTLASAPTANAKEPKNYSWTDIQVITSTPGCGNKVEASRYNAKGKLLGTRTLIKPTPNIQVIPEEYDYRTGRKPRNFLFQTYDCNSKQQNIYEWNLAAKNSSPKLVRSTLPGEMLLDVSYDPASQNVVYIRWGQDDRDKSVDMLLRPGGVTRIWDGWGNLNFTPRKLRTDNGGELGIIGLTPQGPGNWAEVLVNTKRPMEQGYINRVGPGDIRSVDAGTINASGGVGTGFLSRLTPASVYVASGSEAWLCTGFDSEQDVRANKDCLAFRPIAGGFSRPDVHFGSGKAKGSDRMDSVTLLYWNGGPGNNYVQPVGVDPTGLARLGSFMQLDNGPARGALDLVPATDTSHAIDAFKVKAWRAR